MQADNRVGLDLDSISGSGDTGKLTTDLTSFTNMGQGYNQSLGAWLDTSTVGSFSAHYLLTLSDADVGASNTRGTYQMDINLVGNVAAVPEPETYALMLAGLGLMGFVARRRQQRNS
ncbi:MAG: PEP-CTERM sorting domain-containing protein [Rhodocyclaceae bacterium]|nr:PEP-CTERM sorting domain-containing protein [Rhodocyclaceae bacterium]